MPGGSGAGFGVIYIQGCGGGGFEKNGDTFGAVGEKHGFPMLAYLPRLQEKDLLSKCKGGRVKCHLLNRLKDC